MKSQSRPGAQAVAFFFIFGGIATGATLEATYTFNGNLNAQQGGAPALVATDPLGMNAFTTDTVFGNANQPVYSFNGNPTPTDQQAGLTFDDSSNLISPSSYSLEIVFDLADVAGYKRVVDVQNRQSDDGLYLLNGHVNLYPTATGTDSIAANTYADLIYTDDGTTVNAYLNGTLEFSDADSQLNIDNGNNSGQLVNLFLDNLGGGGQGEFSDGNIALFEAFDGVLSSDDVATLSSNPFANVGSSAPEPSSLVLLLAGVGMLAGVRRVAFRPGR
jgi:hypothetical protein